MLIGSASNALSVPQSSLAVGQPVSAQSESALPPVHAYEVHIDSTLWNLASVEEKGQLLRAAHDAAVAGNPPAGFGGGGGGGGTGGGGGLPDPNGGPMSNLRNPLPLVRLVSGEPTPQTRAIAALEMLIVTIIGAVLLGYGMSLAPESVILRAAVFGVALTYLVRSYVGYLTP